MAVKKALSDSSKLQSCARAVHRAGGSTREQPTGRDTAHSGRVHWTEQRILEVTTGRSPRGLVTSSPRVSAVSYIPVLPKPPPLGSSGVHSGGFGDTGVPGCAPGGVQDQGGCRARAAAALAGADTGEKAAARGRAGTKPTYIELGRAALRCKARHSHPGCPGTQSAFSDRKASSAAGTSGEESQRPQEGRIGATTLVGKAYRERLCGLRGVWLPGEVCQLVVQVEAHAGITIAP